MTTQQLHRHRILPAGRAKRGIAGAVYEQVCGLPIIAPNGHTYPRCWVGNPAFSDPTAPFATPDHPVTRMINGKSVSFEARGIGPDAAREPLRIWRCIATQFHLFRGTQSRLRLDDALERFGAWTGCNTATFQAILMRITAAVRFSAGWGRRLVIIAVRRSAPTLILFVQKETTNACELAPPAGASLRLGLRSAGWLLDSYDGIRRYREMKAQTTGIRNTAGFSEDIGALCSIPVRHDVARRVNSGRLDEEEQHDIAPLPACGLAREAYRL